MKALSCAVLSSLFSLQSIAAIVDVSVEPHTSVAAPGQSVFVNLVANYSGSDLLLGGAISLSFRADLLEVKNVTVTAPHDVAATTGSVSIDNQQATLVGIGFSTFAGASGAFELATIELKARGPLGSSALTPVDALDPIFAWASETLQSITVVGQSGSVTIVPEPNAFIMLFAGLSLLLAAARRKQSRAIRANAQTMRS